MTETIVELVKIIPLVPLGAFFVLLFIALVEFLRKDAHEREHQYFTPAIYSWTAILAMAVSWIVSMWMLIDYFFVSKLAPHSYEATIYDWVNTGSIQIPFGILVDPLSVIMAALVTTLVLGIEIYSMAYMEHDGHLDHGYPRYMAFLSLFGGGMLMLVLSSNFIVLFIGWEVMGLCSFVLISFWYGKSVVARSGRKAFLYTKLGDVTLMAGFILLMQELTYYDGGYNFDFTSMRNILLHAGEEIPEWKMTLIALLIFGGVVGKSAQFPLFGWLSTVHAKEDAMQGPTTVSALIHAAAMVKAGVFLLLRTFWLLYRIEGEGTHLELVPVSPAAAATVAWIGGFTALSAGMLAVYTTDLKRVLGFSTVSQLAYMVMGIGAGGLAAGLMHVISHATFKATLFLAAGSVHHAVHTYDMTELGGLRKKLPITFTAAITGALALAGVPLTNGFVTKDAILYSVYHSPVAGAKLLYIIGYVAALLTAFYTGRWLYLIFFGEPRDQHKYEHAHESAWPMKVVLVALTGLIILESIFFSGSLFIFDWKGEGFEHFLTHNLSESILGVVFSEEPELSSLWLGVGLSFVISLTGLYLAYLVYKKNPTPTKDWAQKGWYPFVRTLYESSLLADATIMKSFWLVNNTAGAAVQFTDEKIIDDILIDKVSRDWIALGGAALADETDIRVIDPFIEWIKDSMFVIGRWFKRLQAGFVGNYVTYMVGGVVFVLAYVVTQL